MLAFKTMLYLVSIKMNLFLINLFCPLDSTSIGLNLGVGFCQLIIFLLIWPTIAVDRLQESSLKQNNGRENSIILTMHVCVCRGFRLY